MTLSTKQLFQKAEQGGYAIGQFNASTADQIKAIMKIARALKSPVIIGTSEGERDFLGVRVAVKLLEAYEEETGLPIILNADHTKSAAKAEIALKAGYNSIHFDGSELAYEENVKQTKYVVEMCARFSADISVEGELGFLAGASKIIKEKVEIKPEYYTDPAQALDFVTRTGVDRMAIIIGNSHGISIEEPALDIARLKQTYNLIKGRAVIVLHGGSGIPDAQIKDAIVNGIRKINVNTELRAAFHDTLKKVLNESDETTPYKYLAPAMDAMADIVDNKITLFGSANKV
ncbi:class II fructose-bisphosphate aldolase [Candidatus Azambacteria bacterium]|nr:class II fructose-bisphosphate aldolase [Candidatus Azambacteria bacterium]MBI3685191.1 class II fructose-bisphosphate aldolase [Candidatus Azambacteria bacterium]